MVKDVNDMFFGDSSYAGRMQLINVRGQNVMTKEITILKNTIQEIDVDWYLSAGIYFVRFEDRSIAPTRIFVY